MTEQEIFNYLVRAGLTKEGAAGLMGNLFAESGLKFNNLENTANKKLGMTDDQYMKAVDNGTYTNFVHDGAGWGIQQLTFWTRKQNFLQYVQSRKKSIGDPETQMEFLVNELKGYHAVWPVLTSTGSIRAASDVVLLQYERPRDQSEKMKQTRAKYGQDIYFRCSKSSAGQNTNAPSAYYIDGLDYSPIFNAQYYKTKYVDLQNAFKNDTQKYWEHFKLYGMREGRQGSENFNVIAYRNANPDLLQAFENNFEKYYRHYLLFGKNEGRKCV